MHGERHRRAAYAKALGGVCVCVVNGSGSGGSVDGTNKDRPWWLAASRQMVWRDGRMV